MFEFSSIEQYHAQLLEGKTTCVPAAKHYLKQISEKSRLNAFVNVYADEVLQNAALLDKERISNRKEGKPLAKLHGVVIGIKDVISYKDHPLSASSKILNGFNAIYSATAVERLQKEEALIIGHLNCDEFAMGSSNENSNYGNVLNALDETRVPGGSSGGSAVAVQAKLCMLSLGSDTGGSVRQPADFCGIIGFKPGYGRISRYGLIAYASSFDQIGIFGKNIADIANCLEVMSGPDEFDATVLPRQLPSYPSKENPPKYRIAYFEEALNHPALDPEISSSVRKMIEELKEQGHELVPVEFDLMDYVVPAYYVLTTAEASSNLSRYDGVRFGYRSAGPYSDLTDFYKRNRSEGFGKEVKRRILLGTFVLSAGYYDAYFTRAQKVRKMVQDRLDQIFLNFDFILMPSSPTTAFKLGEKMTDAVSMYLADIYTVTANLAGIPAISIPLFRHSNGMPFSLQLMASRQNEVPLLTISERLLRNYAPANPV